MGLEFEVVAVATRTDSQYKHLKKGEVVAPWPIENVTLRVPFSDDGYGYSKSGFRRVHAGRYELKTTTTVMDSNGTRTIPATVTLQEMQWAGPDKWGIEIAGHIHPDTDSRLCSIDDAPSPTKGEAIKTARAMLEHGFKLHPGLGWCAR